MATYTIGEAARRSGFSPATLRYYDDLGLVSPQERTESGYRRYDDRDLDRLRFVQHAKQLGCSLDEVSALLVAWDGGRCGPLQDQLRTLLAAKIAASQQRLVDMTMLVGELRRAAANLERHRPVGACDDLCGCLEPPGHEGNGVTAPTFVALGRAVAASPHLVPIACTLAPEATPDRLADFQRLSEAACARLPLDDGALRGIRLEFEHVDIASLANLLAAEHECCRFWEFAVTIDSRGVGLEVRGPDGTADLIDALFGVAA
jgi:MerR family transcriptional regulator, copper efflux regulator